MIKTVEELNIKIVEGLENLVAYVNSPEFEALVLAEALIFNPETHQVSMAEWTNALHVNLFKQVGQRTGLLTDVKEEEDGFSIGVPEDQPDHIDHLFMQSMDMLVKEFKAQTHHVALADGSPRQQLQGVRRCAAGTLAQSRAHLAGAHAPHVQH